MYIAEMLGRSVHCFWQAFRTINGFIAMVLLLLSVAGSTVAATMKDLSPMYPFAAVVALFGWLFLKASYEKDIEREAACNVKLAASQQNAVEAETLRAANEARASKAAHARQQLYAYADSAPIGELCTITSANGWIAGAFQLVDTVLVNRGGFQGMNSSRLDEAEHALYVSVGSLRAVAARLTPDQLR